MAWKNHSVASAVWYSPSCSPSGKRLGISPSRTWCENVSRILARRVVPTRHQSQSLEADHRVAPPIGEPGIARDDRPAASAPPRHIFGAGHGIDDELVRGQNQLAWRAAAGGRVRGAEQPVAPPALFPVGVAGRRGPDRLPRLGRRRQGDPAIRGQVGAEVSRALEHAHVVVAAARLDLVLDAPDGGGVPRERRTGDGQTQRWHAGVAANLGGALAGRDLVPLCRRFVQRRIVPPERHQRTQAESNWSIARHEAVDDVDGVPAMRHHDRAFDHRLRQPVGPDGETGLEPEPGETLAAVRLAQLAVQDVRVEPDGGIVGEAHLLGQVVEEHHTPERPRMGSHQEAVEAARDGADYRAAGIPAQTVRDEPLGPRVRARCVAVAIEATQQGLRSGWRSVRLCRSSRAHPPDVLTRTPSCRSAWWPARSGRPA